MKIIVLTDGVLREQRHFVARHIITFREGCDGWGNPRCFVQTIKGDHEVMESADAVRAMLEAPAVCAWEEDADGTWHSACGKAWAFTEGGPTENGAHFCHHCGKPIDELPYEEEL